MKYYISKKSYYSAVSFFISLCARRSHEEFLEVDGFELADIYWDDQVEGSQPIALGFYDELEKNQPDLHWEKILSKECDIKDSSGKTDVAATVFYFVNCLQEYNPSISELDKFDRFKYSASYQNEFKNITDNLVERFLTSFLDSLNIAPKKEKSQIFISHDIDTIRGAIIQDSFWSLKKMRIDYVFSILFNELFRRPSWENIDRIISIQDQYDLKSTFFWLVSQGKDKNGIPQADYSLAEVDRYLQKIEGLSNFESGLHKSTLQTSLNEELEKTPYDWVSNRYHFLKFNPYPHWEAISDSGIKLDASLGFAEHYGFRNSFGSAFTPYDFKKDRYFDFVEVPLILMDMTFKNYLKIPANRIAPLIIDFIEKNSENCTLSILWHNTFFSDYKFGDYLNVYKQLAAYFYEKQLDTVNASDILNKYEGN